MFTYWRTLSIMLLAFQTVLFGQSNKIELTIDEALRLAKENNYEINMAKAEVDIMQADKNKSLAVFLPQITLSETFIRTDDALNVFGFKLKQRSVTAMDFNPALLNNPDPFNNWNTKIDVLQPLLNFDGFYGRAAAGDGLSAIKYKQKRTENYMLFMVKMNYYQITLMEKSLVVVDEALQTAKANLKLFTDYYDEGLITKADLLKGHVFVSDLESKFVEVKGQYETTSDNLKQMLGIKEAGIIKPTNGIERELFVKSDSTNQFLIENRSDIMAYRYKMNAMSNKSTMNWLKFVPRLNAFGIYEFNDTKAFGGGSKSWMVGLNLQWQVFNGYQNVGEIEKSKAEYRHAQLEYEKAKTKGLVEIESAYRDVETALKQIELAENAVEQSQESLRIIKDRYEKGLEKTADLLIAETEFSNSKLKLLQTDFMYNVSLYKLELMTETTDNKEEEVSNKQENNQFNVIGLKK